MCISISYIKRTTDLASLLAFRYQNISLKRWSDILKLMFSHCGTSVGEEKGGEAHSFSVSILLLGKSNIPQLGDSGRERLLIRHVLSSVYSVISADLQDVPYILYYVQINKQINSHEKGLFTQRFTLKLVRNQQHVATLLKGINRGKKNYCTFET